MTDTHPPGFSISKASQSDLPEIWQVFLDAYEKDEQWVPIVQNVVHPVGIHSWVCANLSPRWEMPDVEIYKVTEDASGTIAGWGGLQVPWKYRQSSMTDELKAQAASEALPPGLEGMNMEALREFYGTISESFKYGYNPETDYHRRGSFIRPNFQRMRLGTALTHLCNGKADETDDKIWAPARPSSVGMFKSNGFKEVGYVDSHFERWGGAREKSKTFILLRQ